MLSEWLLFTSFGLLIGSFLNACIYRLPHDISLSYPKRSFCPKCGAAIGWYDNLPLVSWIALRGRCRACQSPIPWRYPLVEFLTGAAFGLSLATSDSWLDTLRLALFSALMILLFFTDLETRILPDEATIGGAWAGWLLALAAPIHPGVVGLLLPEDVTVAGRSFAASLLGSLLPAALLWTIGELYRRIRQRDGLGFGDVKMVMTIGAFLGLEGVLLTIAAASVAGTVFGLILLARRGRDAALYELPFGSFLAAAAIWVAHTK